MEALWQDLRYGLRTLVRNPGFAVAAVVTLGVGIAANTAVFSLANAFFLRPLPFEAPEELVHLWQTDRDQGQQELRVSVPNFLDLKEQMTAFEDLGGYFYQSFNLSSDEAPARVLVGRLTANLLPILGVEPILGRGFLPEEGEPGRDRVAVLSYGFWHRRFAARPDVLGKTVVLDGETYAIVGVMPPEFVFPLKATELWSPLCLDPWRSRREMDGPLLVVGRLQPGRTLEEARAEAEAVMRRLEQTFPEENRHKSANVVPLKKALVFFYDMLQLTFGVLFVAASFVLLIVCANVGNLLLARASGRSREIALRAALGGGRRRLIRQLLTESAVLALVGGALGSVLAYWLVRVTGPKIPEDLYRVGEISIDLRALGFTLGACLAAALLFGLAPALQTTRPNLVEALKEGSRGSGEGSRSRRLRSALVVAEVALALVLLAGATLMLQSFARLREVDVGFSPDSVLTVELDVPESKYPTRAEQNLFYGQVLERVRSLPSVHSAAAVYPLPLNFEAFSQSFAIADRSPAEPGEKLSADKFWATTGYFTTMGIPLVKGRAFADHDDDHASPAVIINQRMAERFWPGEDPVGKAVLLDPGTEEERLATIIGIVGNSKHFLLSEDTASLIYLPQLQRSTERRFLTVRAAGDPLALVDSVRDQIRAVDPAMPVSTIRSMDQVVAESLGPWAGGTAVMAVLGLGALALAAMGVYGVISFSVGQRTHEMGVRIALGAPRGNILNLVLKQAAGLAGAGIGIGLAATFGLAHLMQALLYGVGAFDPVTLAGTPLVLCAVAFLASYIPARRAMRVDPITALRYE